MPVNTIRLMIPCDTPDRWLMGATNHLLHFPRLLSHLLLQCIGLLVQIARLLLPLSHLHQHLLLQTTYLLQHLLLQTAYLLELLLL